jgi:hypothetical protein
VGSASWEAALRQPTKAQGKKGVFKRGGYMSSVKIRSRAQRVVSWCFTVLSLATLAFGQPAITVSPGIGPPATTTLVSGSGFSPTPTLTVETGKRRFVAPAESMARWR